MLIFIFSIFHKSKNETLNKNEIFWIWISSLIPFIFPFFILLFFRKKIFNFFNKFNNKFLIINILSAQTLIFLINLSWFISIGLINLFF